MSPARRVLVDLARALHACARACAVPFALALVLLAAGPPDARAAGTPPAPSSLTIDRAAFCLAPGLSDTVPDATCGWESVQLAKVWHPASKDAPLGDAWFKLHFHLDAVPAQGLAMYTVAFNRSAYLRLLKKVRSCGPASVRVRTSSSMVSAAPAPGASSAPVALAMSANENGPARLKNPGCSIP